VQGFEDLEEWFFEHLPGFLFPKEWLSLDAEMSKAELLCLFLVERRGECTMSQLAQDIRIPLSTLSGIVDRLVKGGALSRERPESDRRRVLLRLATPGKVILERLKAMVGAYAQKALAALDDEEKALGLRLVMKLVKALQEPGDGEGLEDSGKRAVKIRIE
jgi:DNA-binding MarR family transcriptional regulator